MPRSSKRACQIRKRAVCVFRLCYCGQHRHGTTTPLDFQFHRRSYKARDRLMPLSTSRAFLTVAVCIELVAAFNGREVDLLCAQCNSSFFCTGGNRFECPAHSLAHSWPADNVTSCTCNNGFLATPARDACGVGTPPFYYEAGNAKVCTGGLRQTVHVQADSGYACV